MKPSFPPYESELLDIVLLVLDFDADLTGLLLYWREKLLKLLLVAEAVEYLTGSALALTEPLPPLPRQLVLLQSCE